MSVLSDDSEYFWHRFFNNLSFLFFFNYLFHFFFFRIFPVFIISFFFFILTISFSLIVHISDLLYFIIIAWLRNILTVKVSK